MGQGQSTCLLVQLERSTYSPTELVRGTVYFNVSEAFETDALVLRVIGEEHARWTEECYTGLDYDESTYRGRTQLIGHETTLIEKGLVEPGSYAFPFQFVLPSSLPGSLEWDQKNCTKASLRMRSGRAAIAYSVQAICVKPGRLDRNIKSEPLPFKVLPVSSVPYTGPAEFKDSQTSMVCGCFPRGGISGSLLLPTNVAHVGSVLLIKGHLENKATAPIKKVLIHLVQRTSLRSNSGKSYSGFITHVTEVDVDCPQASLQPGSSTKLECKVPVPLSIPPSFFGRHIQIDYTIELLGKMDSLTHSFRMDAPIIISSSPPQMLPGPIPSTTPGSGSIPSSLPPKTAGDLPQSYGGVALPSKAAAPALDPHPPLSTVSPGPPHPALPQANGGEAQPCYSYPPMQAPPNWYPSIQKTAYLDLSTPSATNAKWADGDNDDNDDGFK
eukprot:CAMPEP_0202340250 /NCGR_PEP_ID=MMETSP1126-20121109/1768_1 /ASSEMBLY_ACC=CAM_ASM_000457 /TAXON_ID=3047 /ORGANISM="Dunaliella tertiolecta, Strain CCMP1320" /LENGTH=440 /DNA_ID=CAMNT_0048930925 /DNA_START=173 /DNA_END=1495 /DNA_ORIENTATION=-